MNMFEVAVPDPQLPPPRTPVRWRPSLDSDCPKCKRLKQRIVELEAELNEFKRRYRIG